MTHPETSPEPGVRRRVLTDAPELMLVRVAFDAGATGARHQHPHVQCTYVESGRFRFTLGDRVHEVGPGDTLTMAANLPHGCECLEAGVLIDSFAPRRDDFL